MIRLKKFHGVALIHLSIVQQRGIFDKKKKGRAKDLDRFNTANDPGNAEKASWY